MMFSEKYRVLCRELFVVREPEGAFSGPTPQRLRHQLVKSIWADQLLDASRLRTADGRALKVISPGWPNEAEGPDFRRVQVEIDGQQTQGDVLVHTYASHWTQHKHDADPQSGGVILHAVMWNNRTSTTVRTPGGTDVPILVMSEYLERPLEEVEDATAAATVVADLKPAQPVLTQEQLARIMGRPFGEFLDAAGDWRILSKALKFGAALKKDEPDELFYRAFMEALGYARNRAPFARLAAGLPLKSLREAADGTTTGDTRDRLFAVLAKAAGLIPQRSDEHDDQTRRFVEQLHLISSQVAVRQILSKEDWTLKGVRPANHPLRRIAAAANFLANCGEEEPLDGFVKMFKAVAQGSIDRHTVRPRLEAMIERISGGPDHYYHTRYAIGTKVLAVRRELIGRQLALVMIVNVVVPVVLALCRKRDDTATEAALHTFYAHLPGLPEDNITRFVKTRILVRKGQASQVTGARRQQALYQIYNDLILH